MLSTAILVSVIILIAETKQNIRTKQLQEGRVSLGLFLERRAPVTGKEREATAHTLLHCRSREPWAPTKLALSINLTLCHLDLANT